MDSAMSRIEAALARIEHVAARTGGGRPGGGSELAAQHDTLRTRVTSALVELDSLIESLET